MRKKPRKTNRPLGRLLPMTDAERAKRQRKNERRFSRELSESEAKEFVEKMSRVTTTEFDGIEYTDEWERKERDNG